LLYFLLDQDAHELFHILTQSLDEETARYPRVVSLFDVASIEVCAKKLKV